jgi:hypothetical protein
MSQNPVYHSLWKSCEHVFLLFILDLKLQGQNKGRGCQDKCEVRHSSSKINTYAQSVCNLIFRKKGQISKGHSDAAMLTMKITSILLFREVKPLGIPLSQSSVCQNRPFILF